MKRIGLTGTSGSGKGYVSACFAGYGIESVDTDAVVHRLYRENRECIDAIESAFGAVRAADGSVDRKKLAAIVFADPEKLSVLNAIVHGYVRAEVERICEKRASEGCEVLLIDAPQLYEAGMDALCDAVIAVVAPESLRLERICARDGIDPAAALQRICNQHPDAFFEARADYVIRNDGVCAVEAQVERIVGEWKHG